MKDKSNYGKLCITEYSFSADVERAVAFLFVSDIHGCDDDRVREAISRLSFDAVLVCGDYIHSAELAGESRKFLRFLSSRAPVFCSVGNHERKCGVDYKKLATDEGAVLLDNEMTELFGIKLFGLSSGFSDGEAQGELIKTPAPDTKALADFAKEEGYKLVMSHHPEYYDGFIKNLDIDLTLSGHAHGGQWRFFGRGIFAPGQFLLPKYTSGIYDGRLIVCRGLGSIGPFPRINNTPEVVLLKFSPEG